MPRPPSPLPGPLADAVRRFGTWRRTRTHRWIPEPLWELATQLGGEYGVSRTAQALGLDYYGLRRRVEEAGGGDSSELVKAPAFVEVLPTACDGPRDCQVELEDRQGVKLRIQWRDANLEDLVAVGRLLLGR